MTSPLPPRLRDTKSIVDRVRQDRTNLQQLGVGFMGGRFPPLRPLGSAALLGDIEDDTATDEDAGLDLLLFDNDDTVTWSGTGDLVIGLSHQPWSDSLWIALNGHRLQVADWSYRASLNAVTIPAEPWWAEAVAAGAEIVGTAYYAYLEADDVVEGSPIVLAFESANWKFKQVGRTDATDYSSPSFDDSSWTTATAAFGDGGDMADDTGGEHATLWSKTTRMWMRRTLTGLTSDVDITAKIRVDYSVNIYLGGVLVYSGAPNGTQVTATIAGSDVTDDTMVLAVRATDEAASIGCYCDLELTQ